MTNQKTELKAGSSQDAFKCLELARVFEERADIVAADRWRERARQWARAFADGEIDAGKPLPKSLEEAGCA